MPAASITFLGHSTVVLRIGAAAIVTDPVLRSRVGPLRRLPPPPEPLDRVAAVLVSHVHHDHLDLPSLRRLAPEADVVVPAGAARLLRRAGFRRVVELAPGASAVAGGVEIEATAAEHPTARLPWQRPVPALGYLIGAETRIYFAGDTDLFDGMVAIGDRGLALALLPVAGWGPRLPPGHMDAARAAAALRLLRPQVAVPIHWGTLAPSWRATPGPAEQRAPAERFAREAAAAAPEVEVRILAPGESLTLAGRPP